MGTPGVAHGYTKAEITEALRRNQGKVTYAARELNLHWDTLYEFFALHPDLWDVVEECRKSFKRYKNKAKVELSEMYQNSLLTKKDVPYSVGLRASMYILDNLGEEEGYSKSKDSHLDFDSTVTIIDARHNSSSQVPLPPLPGPSLDSD